MTLPEFMEHLQNEVDDFECSLLAGLVVKATKEKWFKLFNTYIESNDK